MTSNNNDADKEHVLDESDISNESASGIKGVAEDVQMQRKVAPTLLEPSMRKKGKTDGDALTNLRRTREVLTKASAKIARTLIEGVTDSRPPSSSKIHPGDKLEQSDEGQIFVAKTMLDYDLIQHALGGAIEKTAQIAADNKPEKLPGLPDVEGFQPATTCPSKAVCTGKQRIDYCGTCGIEMYNLNGLDADEARRLIFTRENRENPPLFKRHDGLFMTRDCPMVAKSAKKKIMLIVALVLIVVGSIALISLLPPPPKPAPAPAEADSTATPAPTATVNSEDTTVGRTTEIVAPVQSPDQSTGASPVQAPAASSKSQGQYYYELPAAPPQPTPMSPAGSANQDPKSVGY